MRSALSLSEVGQLAVALLSGVVLLLSHHCLPSIVGGHTSGGLELHLFHLSQDGGGIEETVGVESSYEPSGYQVIHLLLHLAHTSGGNSCGDDGMVVRDLAVVKYLLALAQRFTLDALHEWEVCPQSVEYLRTLGVHVVGQEGGIYSRIGGEFLLIERLYELQGKVGAEPILLVALHLQAC